MKKNRQKIAIVIAAIILLIITGRQLATPYRISGDCMELAIIDGKLYFLNRISPYLRHYQIDDIIVFKHEGKEWISRIVALENNKIQSTEESILLECCCS